MLPYQPVICHYEQQWKIFDDETLKVSSEYSCLCEMFLVLYVHCSAASLRGNFALWFLISIYFLFVTLWEPKYKTSYQPLCGIEMLVDEVKSVSPTCLLVEVGIGRSDTQYLTLVCIAAAAVVNVPWSD